MIKITTTAKRSDSMKKIILIIAIALLLGSMFFALYPTISRTCTKTKCEKYSVDFDSITENVQDGSFEEAKEKGIVDDKGYLVESEYELPVLFKQDLERLYDDSISYNQDLNDSQSIHHSSDFENSALDLYSYGIMNDMYGYIQIPDIELTLPIYLGATEYNMRYGCAHLNKTSLPAGGSGTNCVLAGHTGYSGKTFFDNIRYLRVGATVKIKNYFTTLNYEVLRIENVTNDNLESIYIEENKDLLTLMTCSNSGTTRLLVICERTN